MKQIFTICRTTYVKWLLNTKMFVLLLAGIFMYIYCIVSILQIHTIKKVRKYVIYPPAINNEKKIVSSFNGGKTHEEHNRRNL